MIFEEMRQRIASGEGFIAALDQSGGSTPKALKGYGIEEGAWSNEEEMFALIHQMRQRIIEAECFGSGKSVPARLAERGVVPFLKVDKGLEDERDGVQLMKPMPDLEALCARVRALGVFGTKMRSVIKRADERGIEAIVAQQFEEGRRILGAGLVPILEPEYDIHAPDRAEGERSLLASITRHLDTLGEGEQVMLKLSIPAEAGLYAPLIGHPRVLRVVALSGGYSTEEACEKLAQNPGMIASFSRGLLQDLRHAQSDAEFDATLGAAIDRIHAASVA
jgi:fructose-bisphosphate aldolase, class I